MSSCAASTARLLAGLSLFVIDTHDLHGRVPPKAFGRLEFVWRLLHVPGVVRIGSLDRSAATSDRDVRTIWLAIVVALYVPCRVFERVKGERRSAWLKLL